MLSFFDRKFSLLLLFFCLPLLFLPKINLMSVDATETAGIRIDDCVLLITSILLIWAHHLSRHRFYRIEGWILMITALGVISFLINQWLVSTGISSIHAKVFYSLRLLEYFLFFYVGALTSQYFQDRLIVKTFFLWNLFLMILQKLQLAGAIVTTGYHSDVSGRVQGIASFPSEMGLLLNLLFCYFVFDSQMRLRFISLFRSARMSHFFEKIYLYGMFCLFGVFIIFTGNRISIIALFVCFIFRLRDELKLRSLGNYISMILFIALTGIGIGFVITQTSGVYARSADLFSLKNIELFEIVWAKIDISHPLDNEMIGGANYDMSWWIRIHKWLFMAKTYLVHPESYLQGLGPGYAGAALDGGLLRILTEYGLIGVFLFWKFFETLARINRQTQWMVIAFLINMIFFDAYLAYKTMSFLLFTCGYIFVKEQSVASHLINEANRRPIGCRD